MAVTRNRIGFNPYDSNSAYWIEPTPQVLTFQSEGWAARMLSFGRVLENNRTGRVANSAPVQTFANHSTNANPLIEARANALARYGGTGGKGNGSGIRGVSS